MNIIGLELEYIPTFHILPHAYITLGKSVWLSFSWLNFQLTIKHISCDYKSSTLSLYTPSATLHIYPNSGYLVSFEVCIFGYVYRKGLFKRKDRDIQPTDNTNGFVPSSWFLQFGNPMADDFLKDLCDLINKFKDKEE